MTYRYHPPTVDSLDITPSDDGLAVRLGIFNATDSGTYTSIEVMNRDLEEVITALHAAAAPTPPAPVEGTYVVTGSNGEEWVGTAQNIFHAESKARSANPGINIIYATHPR